MNLPRSLQQRLLVLVIGMVVAVWLATAAMTWRDVSHELDELLDSHLAQAAALLVVQQTQEVEGEEHDLDAPSLHRYAPKVAFQVFHEGRLALRSANAPAQPMINAGPEPASGYQTVQLEGTAWRVFATHGAEHDVRVYVGEQMHSRQSILWAVLRSTLLPMVVALPLLALAAWWAIRRGLLPLRQLGDTLAARQPQALTPVVMDDAPSEMLPMVSALNGLFERLTEMMASERRFTADAAHELRTPIAAIRTQAQVALGEADEAQRRHALHATLEGCDRATRLVEQLLTLSRLEAGTQPPVSKLDMRLLVQRVVADIAPQALDKQQNIELDAPGNQEALVSGDATLLSVLVRNLVDNAIRYSPGYATVRISVAASDQGVQLTVQDSGPGMNEANMARVGERFFRVLGTGESGSGLGWSIVRRIAAVHRAQVRMSASAELGGLLATVAFPLVR
jgi:two-component system sensor histidine kinase QseC